MSTLLSDEILYRQSIYHRRWSLKADDAMCSIFPLDKLETNRAVSVVVSNPMRIIRDREVTNRYPRADEFWASKSARMRPRHSTRCQRARVTHSCSIDKGSEKERKKGFLCRSHLPVLWFS